MRHSLLVGVVFASLPIGTLRPQAQLRLEQEMIIPGADLEWNRIFGFAARPDGATLVSVLMRPNIWLHGPDGELIRVGGGKGEGPGEFGNAGRVGATPSGFWVIDNSRPVVNFFANDLTFVNSARLPLEFQFGDAFRPAIHATVIGIRRDRNLIVSASTPPAVKAIADWLMVPPAGAFQLLTTPAGKILRSIGLTPESVKCSLHGTAGKSEGRILIPFCRTELSDLSPNGELMLYMTDHARTDGRPQFTMTVVRTDGDTVYSVPTPYEPVQVDRLRSTAARSDLDRRRRAMASVGLEMGNAKVPEMYPAFEDAVLASDGQAWVKRWSDSDRNATWWRYSARGVRIGAVELPQSARIVGAELNLVWVEIKDAYDVPSLARFRIGYQ